jgi:hypothetical protein
MALPSGSYDKRVSGNFGHGFIGRLGTFLHAECQVPLPVTGVAGSGRRIIS